MEKIKWSKRFSIKNETIDSQHKQLIDLANNLLDTFKDPETDIDIENIFQNIKECSKKHFDYEENYIRRYAPYLLEEQEFEHKKFINTINSLYDQYKDRGQETGLKLLEFLLNWIYDHMLYIDKKIPAPSNLQISGSPITAQ